MDKTKKVLTDIHSELVNESIKENLKAQQEVQDKLWKQDCRRTSIQLAERFSKDINNSHESDPVRIIANAEILYRWLIADEGQQNDLWDIFMKTGVVNYKK